MQEFILLAIAISLIPEKQLRNILWLLWQKGLDSRLQLQLVEMTAEIFRDNDTLKFDLVRMEYQTGLYQLCITKVGKQERIMTREAVSAPLLSHKNQITEIIRFLSIQEWTSCGISSSTQLMETVDTMDDRSFPMERLLKSDGIDPHSSSSNDPRDGQQKARVITVVVPHDYQLGATTEFAIADGILLRFQLHRPERDY
jgi:hypothetical protein